MGDLGGRGRRLSGARPGHPHARRSLVRGLAQPRSRKSGARRQGEAPRHRHYPDQEGDPGGSAPCRPPRAPLGRSAPVTRRQVLTQVLVLWALAFAAILVAYLSYPPAAKIVSVAVFLYLPLWSMRRTGEEPADVGLTLRNWRADVLWATGLFLVIAVGYFFALKWWLTWTLV